MNDIRSAWVSGFKTSHSCSPSVSHQMPEKTFVWDLSGGVRRDKTWRTSAQTVKKSSLLTGNRTGFENFLAVTSHWTFSYTCNKARTNKQTVQQTTAEAPEGMLCNKHCSEQKFYFQGWGVNCGFFPFSVQKLSEFLSSEEIGEEHDKSSELRSADNHSKYQAVVSKAVSLPVKWLQ